MSDAKPDLSRLSELASGLGLHEHLCLIYDTQEEQFAVALPYLRAGLERRERCLYLADGNGTSPPRPTEFLFGAKPRRVRIQEILAL